MKPTSCALRRSIRKTHDMRSDCRRRDICRLCDGNNLEIALSLPPTPPANAFVGIDRVGVEQPTFPLDVYLCADCTHLQLLDIVDPILLFGSYVYVSGTSPSFVRHFEDYAAEVLSRYPPKDAGFVVDIGSNDGTLLRAFDKAGHRTLGIDPARDIAATATAAGIETLVGFFNSKMAQDIRRSHGPADVVTANNVFAHIDDLGDVTDGVEKLLAPSGVFVLEVSYLVDVVQKNLFDTIYHEHLSYHAVAPLIGFFARHGMQIIDAQRVASHGGSLRCIVQRQDGPRTVQTNVSERLEEESMLGLGQLKRYRSFDRDIEAIGRELRDLIENEKSAGKTISGFGAPAKLTTLMYKFGLDSRHVDFIIDDSPWKQGLFTPGLHLPVVSADILREQSPDYLLIFAWNFAEQIIARNQAFADNGGRFIVPLPRPRVI